VIPDIGLVEMIIIGLVLFLIVGPERIPQVYGQIALFTRKARHWLNDAKDSLQKEVDQIKDPILQAKEVARGEIDQATGNLAGDFRRELRDLKERGEVLKQRPLSETYAEMQKEGQGNIDNDDASQGFMQGSTGKEQTGSQDKAQEAEPDSDKP